MEQKLPIIDIVKQAYQQTFSFRVGLAITVAAMLITGLVALVLIFPFMGEDAAVLGNPLLALVAVLGVFAIVLTGLGWIFNYWVRYGALGAERVLPGSFGASIGPALLTGLKLLIIGIFLAIIAVIIVLVGGALGFGVGLTNLESLAGADSVDLIKAFGFLYLVVFGVSCGIYSTFSANLTQTALGTDKEEVGEPHVMEFAIVLFLIYIILYGPLLVLQSFLPDIAASVLEFMASVLIAALVPVAHGLRYDWQRQVYADQD